MGEVKGVALGAASPVRPASSSGSRRRQREVVLRLLRGELVERQLDEAKRRIGESVVKIENLQKQRRAKVAISRAISVDRGQPDGRRHLVATAGAGPDRTLFPDAGQRHGAALPWGTALAPGEFRMR